MLRILYADPLPDLMAMWIQVLSGEGMKWELTSELKSELVAEGVLSADEQREPPKVG